MRCDKIESLDDDNGKAKQEGVAERGGSNAFEPFAGWAGGMDSFLQSCGGGADGKARCNHNHDLSQEADATKQGLVR